MRIRQDGERHCFVLTVMGDGLAEPYASEHASLDEAMKVALRLQGTDQFKGAAIVVDQEAEPGGA